MALTSRQKQARRLWKMRALGLGYEDGGGGGGGGIEFVDSAVGIVQTGGATENVSLPAGLLENDIVVALVACDNAISFGGGITTSGYNVLQDDGNSGVPGYILAWKRMGATPDSVISITQNATRKQAVILQAFRGVSTTTAIDAQATKATGLSGLPNPPSITTTTANAMIVIVGALDDDQDAANTTAPATYTNLSAQQTDVGSATDVTVMMASKILAAIGTEDPAAFGGLGDDQWFAHTFALMPA